MIRKLVSRSTGLVARIPLPKFLRRPIYGSYSRRYGANLEEAESPIDHYVTMDQFFTRKLRPNARLIDEDPKAIVSPVDGRVSALGDIQDKTLIQAKGLDYSLPDLFANEERHKQFVGGNFLTIYLAPGDCHRVYAPLACTLEQTKRIPGTLFPVREKAVQSVPKLFCVNERVIFYLQTEIGPVAYIMVGALNVGSIEATAKINQSIPKAGELGMFHLGSTVILIFPPNRMNWEKIEPQMKLKIGMRIGQIRS